MKLRVTISLAGAVALCLTVSTAEAQRTPPPSFDSVKRAGPPARLANGHPDFTGVYFPGAVPDPDHYSQEAQAHRTFDPKATPQEPPSFQPWVQEKIKLMGKLDLVNPELQCSPIGAIGYFFKAGYPIGLVQKPEEL